MNQTKTKWMVIAIYIATLITAIEATIVVTATRAITNDLGNPNLTALIFSTYLFSSALEELQIIIVKKEFFKLVYYSFY